MKQITVVCFIKNNEAWLDETIESIVTQTGIDFILIIVDGSIDKNTAELNEKKIEKYSLFNKRCFIIYKNIPDNHPAEGILNAIKIVTTKYITFSAGNDKYVKKDWLFAAVNILEENKNLSLVFGNVIHIDENSNFTYQPWPELYKQKPPTNEFDFFLFCISLNFMMFEVNYVVHLEVIKKLWGNKNYYKNKKIDLVWNDHPSLRFAFDFHNEGYLAKFFPYIVSAGRYHPSTSRNESQKIKNLNFVNLYLTEFKTLREKVIAQKSFTFKNSNNEVIFLELKSAKSEIDKYRIMYQIHFEKYENKLFSYLLKKYFQFLKFIKVNV